MKYRKKPVEIDATQYLVGGPHIEGLCYSPHNGLMGGVHIHTLEGTMNVSHGDWIITGVQGEHYPCKPDIFVATYEPV